MEINNKTFIQCAIKAYENPQCRTIQQFNDDVNRFSLIKKLLKSNKNDVEFIKLALNNIVAQYNVFDTENCTKMLFFKVRQEHWYKLKTYLIFLGYMPEKIPELNLIDSEIRICKQIAQELRLI